MFPNAPLYPYFLEVERKNKGLRARLVDLLATQGHLIKKGCYGNAVREAMLSSAELLRLGN
jgi:hypothetical protein